METVLDSNKNGQCQHPPSSLSSTIYMPIASPPTPAPSPGPILITPNPSLHTQLNTQHDLVSLSRIEFANLAAHGPAARRRYLASLLSDCTHSELLFISQTITPMLERDFFSKLPAELAYHTLSFIDDPKTLARASQVCRRWHDLVADECMWKGLCQRYNFSLSIRSQEYTESDDQISEDFPSPLNRIGEYTQYHDPSIQLPASPSLVRPSYRKHFQYSYTLMCNMRRGGTLLQSHRMSVVTPDSGVITSLAMDYDQVVVGLANSKIHIFNADSGVMSRTLTGHELGVWAVHLVSRGGLWEETPDDVGVVKSRDGESQGQEAFLPPDLRKALGLDGPKRILRTPSHTPSGKPSDICCASEGWGQPNPIVVSGGCDKRLRVWDVVSGRCIYVLEGHTSTIRCIRVLHNRPVAVTGSRDATVRVWNIQEGRLLRVLQGHHQSVRCLDVCGNRVVSGSYDTTCRVWNVDTGECLHVLRGHGLQIYSVAFDGIRIASGGTDTTVRVWDAKSGNCIALLPGHTALVCQLQLSSSAGLLATGGSDGRVITFSLRDYSPLQRIAAHDSSVTSLQFDSNFLITAGNDGRVSVYETQSGAHVIDLSERSESVWKVACKYGTCAIMCRRAGKTVMEIWSFRPRVNSPEPQGFLPRTNSYLRSGASYYSRLS